MVEKMLRELPPEVDLKDPEQLAWIDRTVDQVLSRCGSSEELGALESGLLGQQGPMPVFALLVLKLAKSRLAIRDIRDDVTLSVVLAMYKEHNRIRRNDEHPHGEDFLRRKVGQLEGLLGGRPNFHWRLIVVDDGCPEGSGRIAQEIVDGDGLGERAEVCFLDEGIRKGTPPVRALSSTDDSQKGGSIIYGMWEAAQREARGKHIVIYTDADLSTHLGQVGLLIEPILKEGRGVAIGSRREPDSVVVKKGTRNDRGKLFIYLWKRMVPVLGDVIDTQCGFKAFTSDTLDQILDDLLEYRFAFDIELLLKSALQGEGNIAKVPLAWIDSEEASTTTDLQPYLPMLRSIAAMYRAYLPEDPTREEFASFIEELDESGFARLVENIPSEIVDREPYEFAGFEGVSVDELRRRAD
ncbi:MAG: glycosyltransferase [Gemmatimonadetes bacterium]|nr:glycosyltransferase [Gemmatimonadota bacterium]NNM05400.1 glycosyltransferase [Gemmatimonadota bacterium]